MIVARDDVVAGDRGGPEERPPGIIKSVALPVKSSFFLLQPSLTVSEQLRLHRPRVLFPQRLALPAYCCAQTRALQCVGPVDVRFHFQVL